MRWITRRLIPLLAVPALAAGFSFTAAATQEANALDPGFAMQIYCTLAYRDLVNAENAGDWVTYDRIWAETNGICHD